MKHYNGKVLIIVQNLPVPFDRRVWLESQTLRDNGYKVSVICPKAQEFPKSYEKINDISIYRYKMPVEASGVFSYFIEFAYAWLMTALLSIKVLFKEGFDIVHACNPPETFWVLGAIYKLFGKAFIFDHHDVSPEMFLAKYDKRGGLLHNVLLALEKRSFKTADVVLSTNESYKKVALARGNKNPKDVFIVRSGPELTKLKMVRPEPSLKEGKKYMVTYLGEMCPQDRVDYLVRIADYVVNRLGRRDVLFVLMGGGPAMPMVKQLSEDLGLQEFVRFTGRVFDKDISRYLSTTDICAGPDPYTEYSDVSTMNKILEYMAFAKPIVSFDLQEARYSAQKAAWFVAPNDIVEFARAINSLLNDPDKRKRMGDYGRKRLVEKLSWHKTYKKLIDAYLEVTERFGFGYHPFDEAELAEEALLNDVELSIDDLELIVNSSESKVKSSVKEEPSFAIEEKEKFEWVA
jgi:glycosyltransferase involved in cell wall biosynthesis